MVVGLSVCILSMVLSPLQGVTAIRGDYVIAGTVNCFATQIFPCSSAPTLDVSCNCMLEPWDRSLSSPRISTGADCICTTILSMRMIHVMSSKMSTAKPSTIPNHLLTCRVPISTINIIVLSTMIDSFVAAQCFSASRHLMLHFKCGLRYDLIIRFDPAPVSTKQVVEYSALLLAQIPIRTLCVRVPKRRILPMALRLLLHESICLLSLS